jgi:anthranilate/para-aminobenzoate synthase component II
VARIAVIDNYDSFVYNLVQYLGQLGATPVVHRNDAVSVGQLADGGFDGILLSPGPGRPEDAGITPQVVTDLAGLVPIFGVGHHLRRDAHLRGMPRPSGHRGRLRRPGRAHHGDARQDLVGDP